MVMPGGFLKMRRSKCPETRALLLRECDILEVWEMPTRAVGLEAEQETCVVIAQKGKRAPGGAQSALFKSTFSRRTSSLRALREDLRSTWTFVATGRLGRPIESWNEDTASRIIASPIDCVWRKLDLDRKLADLCVGGTGIDAPLKKASFSPDKLPGFEPYLRTQKRLKPFFLVRQDWEDDPDSEHA
jgi:hypothetical protein